MVALLAAVVVAGCGGSPRATPIGTTYDDPEGAYAIQVDPAWTINVGGFASGVEIWILGPAEGDFTPNLNLLTQAAPGMDLAEYAKASIQNAPKFIPDVSLISQSTVDGPSGQLGRIEYSGTVQSRSLHFLAYFGIRDGTAIVATLTTPVGSFETWRAAVEPYLATLRQK
jgi:hypothetical protein